MNTYLKENQTTLEGEKTNKIIYNYYIYRLYNKFTAYITDRESLFKVRPNTHKT